MSLQTQIISKESLPPKLQKKVERADEIMEEETKKFKPKPKKEKVEAKVEKKKVEAKTNKKVVGQKLSKFQVKTKFTGKHKPILDGGTERQCKLCGKKSFSAWAMVPASKARIKKNPKAKLTEKDFVHRDTSICNP